MYLKLPKWRRAFGGLRCTDSCSFALIPVLWYVKHAGFQSKGIAHHVFNRF